MRNDTRLVLHLPRLSVQGIIMHLQLPNLLCLGIAGIVALVPMTIFSAGFVGTLATSPIWLPLLMIGLVTRRGVPGPILVLRAARFQVRKLRGQTKYRYRPDADGNRELQHEGFLVLPGRSRNVKLLSGQEGAALLHDTGANTVSVIADVAAPSFLSDSDARQDDLVQGYAGMHRGWTLREGIKRFTEIERTMTGSVRAVEDYVHANMNPPQGAPGVADSILEGIRQAEGEVRDHRTQMVWTFDLLAMREQIRGAGGLEAGLTRVMHTEMATLEHAAKEAGFREVRWLTPGQVRALVRMQLDPLSTPALQAREAAGTGDVAAGGEAVIAFDEARDYVQADSGFHRVFWIVQWPQYAVRPGVLQTPIVGSMPDGSPIRHTIAIVKAPVPIGRALKRIKDSKKSWEASERMRQKQGQITSESDKHDWQLLIEQEQRLVAGMGEFEQAAYVCVSATSKAELDQACSAMHTHMSNAGLETHVLYGQQAEALMMCAVPNGEGLG